MKRFHHLHKPMGLGTMGLTLTKRQPQHRIIPIRITEQVRCECGAPATRQVWFAQLNANGKVMLNMMPLCEECLALMQEIDSGIIEVR